MRAGVQARGRVRVRVRVHLHMVISVLFRPSMSCDVAGATRPNPPRNSGLVLVFQYLLSHMHGCHNLMFFSAFVVVKFCLSPVACSLVEPQCDGSGYRSA